MLDPLEPVPEIGDGHEQRPETTDKIANFCLDFISSRQNAKN